MANKRVSGTEMASALKEQLTLITFVILFAGLLATETYYAGFGVRYQLLDLSITHLVYRGLTAVIDSPVLILSYLLTIGWLSFGSEQLANSSRIWAKKAVQPITYLLILVVIVTTYFGAIWAGANAANIDQNSRTSRLPVIERFTDKDGKPMPFQGYRLLAAGKDTVVVFRAIEGPSDAPFIHLLKKESTGEITLIR